MFLNFAWVQGERSLKICNNNEWHAVSSSIDLKASVQSRHCRPFFSWIETEYSTSLFRRSKAANLQPPSYSCQLKTKQKKKNPTASFMQYAQENNHPLTREPASRSSSIKRHFDLQKYSGRTIYQTASIVADMH